MVYRFSRWRSLQRNSTSSFGLGNEPLLECLSIGKPNFVGIAQSAAEIKVFPV